MAALLALQAGYEQRLSGLDSYGSQVEELTLGLKLCWRVQWNWRHPLLPDAVLPGRKWNSYVTGLLVQLGMPSARLRIEVAPAGRVARRWRRSDPVPVYG
ncbi:MAG: hypothetical protein ACLR1G_08815 [Alistipes indistinctus]